MHPAGPDLTSFVLLDPLSTFSATAQKQATFHSNQTLPLVMWEHTKMYLPHCNHCIHAWGSTIWVSWACGPFPHRNQSLAVTDISLIKISPSLLTVNHHLFLVMVALCNRETIYIYGHWSPYVIGQTIIFSSCFFLLLSFFSSPNLSGRRLAVYHTLAHGVALVWI